MNYNETEFYRECEAAWWDGFDYADDDPNKEFSGPGHVFSGLNPQQYLIGVAGTLRNWLLFLNPEYAHHPSHAHTLVCICPLFDRCCFWHEQRFGGIGGSLGFTMDHTAHLALSLDALINEGAPVDQIEQGAGVFQCVVRNLVYSLEEAGYSSEAVESARVFAATSCDAGAVDVPSEPGDTPLDAEGGVSQEFAMLDPGTVAARVGKSQHTVARWCREGRDPCKNAVPFNNSSLIPERDVQAFIDRGMKPKK